MFIVTEYAALNMNTLNYPVYFASSFMENSIGLKRITHLGLASFLWDIGKQYKNPDKTPHNAASDLGLHYLLT